jgi:hypothetical protein
MSGVSASTGMTAASGSVPAAELAPRPWWMPGGEIDPGVLIVQYLIPSSIFGALRWHSGSTVTTIFAHALDNALLRVLPIILAAFYG